jgi:phytoene dehydrogenase-like protein
MSGAGGRVEVAIVGGGLAGLACALDLAREGRDVRLFEASDAPGGRVRTDRVDGFLLDRGFQVILEAYPELRARVDLEALELRRFYPGALVRAEGAFHRMADPALEMADALKAVGAPVGTFSDKLRVARLRHAMSGGDADRFLELPAGTTEELLQEEGFSPGMLDRFFRPFFGGVLLDPDLQVSGRLFRYYFRVFADGPTAVPAGGMGALSQALATGLPPGVLTLEARATSVEPGRITFASGAVLEADAVVVAVEGPEAARLLPGMVEDPGSRPVTCLHFVAPASPVGEGILVLNGEGPRAGPVNHLAVMTDVAPSYAPDDRALVTVTVLGDPAEPDADLERAVLRQLEGWYGGEVSSWERIGTCRIPHGQPLQTPAQMDPSRRPVRLAEGLFVCGDHRDNA